ncbi:MAG: alanine dehydrogenase [Deltaproteobacteria bacterium]|nr:alanine dehydrogenase [Deltaproteobacteria bacterium]
MNSSAQEKIADIAFQTFALVKEIESPENPGSLERRVAMIPDDIGKLVQMGVTVFVEEGAGEGVGFSDDEYREVGATLQSAAEIYVDKDLVLKLKGPALASIPLMKKGCTLFCMAHFHSFPERAKLLEEHQINVIAMEEVLESPKQQSDGHIMARLSMAEALEEHITAQEMSDLNVIILGRNDLLAGALRRAGNRNPKSLTLLRDDVTFEELEHSGPQSLYFYDGQEYKNEALLEPLRAAQCRLFDMRRFFERKGVETVQKYREEHAPYEFGLRRIQCLHETGQAGARYGLKLLKENKPNLKLEDAKVVVLGYGNVGRGAMHEICMHGVKKTHILGRIHTAKGEVASWLKDADLVVNGAEQPAHLRGVNFLVEDEHLGSVVPAGSVVIDLVGGSSSNRSPVEAVIDCTFLTDPHFEKNGVTVSALWGWPMLGMMKESAVRYSGQILDILGRREMLLKGLHKMPPGVKRALVCGPFDLSSDR